MFLIRIVPCILFPLYLCSPSGLCLVYCFRSTCVLHQDCALYIVSALLVFPIRIVPCILFPLYLCSPSGLCLVYCFRSTCVPHQDCALYMFPLICTFNLDSGYFNHANLDQDLYLLLVTCVMFNKRQYWH